MDDLDQMAAAGGGVSGIDEGFGFDWSGQQEAGVGDATVGAPPIPRFDYYIGTVEKVDARLQPFEGGKLEAKITVKVDEAGGPPSTPGRLITGSFVMAPRSEKVVKREVLPLSAGEAAAAKEVFFKTLNRAVQVLGLGTSRPAAANEDAIKAFLAPAVGKQVVFVAYTDKKGYSAIPFGSLRSPDEPAPDPKKKGATIAGKTALQQAQEEIAAYGQPKGSKRPGVTAAARGGAAPSDFA